MPNQFKLEIYTPQKVYQTSLIDSLTVQTELGQLTILPNHVEFLANVDISVLIITKNGEEQHYAVGGGVIHFKSKENTAILVLHSIETVEEIDEVKVLKAKQEAEEKLKTQISYEEQKEAELSLRRAINMINFRHRYKDRQKKTGNPPFLIHIFVRS